METSENPTAKKSGWDESHWEYFCSGCEEPHPSFWKTVTTSDEWEAWYREQMRRMKDCKCFESKTRCHCDVFDIDESQECNNISPNHWESFIQFIKTRHD